MRNALIGILAATFLGFAVPTLTVQDAHAVKNYGRKKVSRYKRKKIVQSTMSSNWCGTHPAQCKKSRKAHKQWCASHPKQCTARRTRNKSWCRSNPMQCAKRRKTDSQFDLDLSN